LFLVLTPSHASFGFAVQWAAIQAAFYHSSVIGPFVAALAPDIEGVCWTGKRAHALADTSFRCSPPSPQQRGGSVNGDRSRPPGAAVSSYVVGQVWPHMRDRPAYQLFENVLIDIGQFLDVRVRLPSMNSETS
jgi:hypothetical protein